MSTKQIEGIKDHPNFAYFDPRQVALQRELCQPHWEDLRNQIINHNDSAVRNDLTVQLAYIATQLEIILEGHYEQNDLCEMICNQLIRKRTGETIIVLDPNQKF